MRNRTSSWLVAVLLAVPLATGAAPRSLDRAAVRAEFPCKPTGPIAVEHRLAARTAVGVPLAIAVTARLAADARDVRIEADASRPSAVLVTQPALERVDGGTYRWTITVVPLEAEAGYLNVIVSADVDGVAQAEAVTVSLRSAAAPEAAPTQVTKSGGEALIALPVEESP